MNIFSNLMYNQSFAVKGKVNIKRLIVSLIITIAIEFVAFYVMIPAFNIHSMEFWEFQGFFLLVFFVLTFKTKGKNNIKLKYNAITKIVGIILVLGVLAVLIGNLVSAKIFNAKRYASIMDIENTKFENIIKPSETINDIALMDTGSARVVGQRAIGALSDVVSQYQINEDYQPDCIKWRADEGGNFRICWIFQVV